jgi:uncharacterized membrane protein (GlpM family)
LGLGIKAVSTALVVVAASVVAERVGPRWGGLVACFPVSAGPAYVLLALEHDAAFIAGSALASFACGAATWAFLTSFVRLARRRRLWPSLLGALAVWLAVALAVRAVPWTLATAGLANAVALAAAIKLAPPVAVATVSEARKNAAWLELASRAGLVGVFVAAVVALSDAIGPSVTGIAAVFPITLSSLAVVINRRFGVAGAASALAGAVKPLIGIACGLAVLSLTPPVLGVWPALGVSLVAALAWPMAMIARGVAARAPSQGGEGGA